jgi:hypothetical protein
MQVLRELVRNASGALLAAGVLGLWLGGCGPNVSTTTSTVGQGGAVITLTSGLSLTVPAGAVSRETAVTLSETAQVGYSDIQIDPADLPLAQAATLAWADEGDDALESDVGTEAFSIHRDGGRASTGVHHCGHFRHWHHCAADGGVDGGACVHHRARDGGDLDDADGGEHHRGSRWPPVHGGSDGGAHDHGGGGCSGHHDAGTPPVDADGGQIP